MKLSSLQRRLLGEVRSRQHCILAVVENPIRGPSVTAGSSEQVLFKTASWRLKEGGGADCAGLMSDEQLKLGSIAVAHHLKWWLWLQDALGNERSTSSCFAADGYWQSKASTLKLSRDRGKYFSSLPASKTSIEEWSAVEGVSLRSAQSDEKAMRERGLAQECKEAVEDRADSEGSFGPEEANASVTLNTGDSSRDGQSEFLESDPKPPMPEAHSEEERLQELVPPANIRHERDRDPEREYFHVFKLEEIQRILEEVKGRDVEVMYVREKCNFTDYMVVVTGRTERHIRAMAEAVVRELSLRCQEIMEGLTPAVEGEPGQHWLLVDAGNIIVHFFTEDEREHYNLEGLWGGKVPVKRKYGPYGEVLDEAKDPSLPTSK